MMTMLHSGIAATALLSCVWDIRTGRIPNWLTVGSAVAGIAVSAFSAGWPGFLAGVSGWVFGVLLFLPWFVAGGMGGGDVKLLAAFGSWLGPRAIVWACLYAMVAGGVLAVAAAVRQRRLRAVLATTLQLAGHTAGMAPAVPVGAHGGIAYAVPIAIGVGVAVWLG